MYTRNNIYLVQENCRVVYGPPDDWIDAVPSYHCELFIKNLPKEFNGEMFLALLKRFGIIYKFRLMVDSSKLLRGYAFTRYTIELDALAAMELLNRYFLLNGERLKVCKSLNKRSLYVANIPKELSYKVLYERFLQIFPKMRKLVLHSASAVGNRGFVFIEFCNHEDALEAQRMSASRGIHLWGTDLRVVWAQMQPNGVIKSKNTFIVRGIGDERIKLDFLQKIQRLSTPADVKKMELIENQGIVTFYNLAVASRIYSELKNTSVSEFSIEWAKNTTQSWMSKRVSDFCAELRMICIANGWQIPIVLFGKNYRKNNVQYGAILLADGNSNFIAFLMEVVTINIYDIQSTMCETVVGIINKIGGLPKESLVYKVTNRSGHQVCRLNSLSELHTLKVDRIRDWDSIREMASTLRQISKLSGEQILSIYRSSFLVTAPDESGSMDQILPNCLAVYPKYRNRPALVFNLNDTEIVLVLRENTCEDRLPPIKYINEHDDNTVHLTWKRKPDEYVFNYVYAGQCDFYHPTQRFNVAPIWIPGHTYRHSVKNFIA